MKKNKKCRLLIGIIITVHFISAVSVFAHPGRTDANGGHWDRKTGTYHFHSGEYAGRNSSGSSSTSEYVPFTPPYEPPTDNPYRKNTPNKAQANTSSSKKYNFWEVGLGILGFLWCIFVPISIISKAIYDSFLEKHLPRYKIQSFIDKIREFQACQNDIIKADAKILDITSTLQIPDLFEIGNDNLPKDKECISDWGSTFTLYKTDTGTKLHTKYKCCSAVNPVHIYWYHNHYDNPTFLCKKCANNYLIPDMTWYEYYLELEHIKEKQKNIENNIKKLQEEIETWHKKCNSIRNKMLLIFCNKNKKALQEANKKYEEIKGKNNW